ncbi:helix-turn-helix domain-containing protein [Halobacillus sp. H74]|uniref:helix-turn-helix domain-containing protein n=1 Tax=Halobacillus sp. H74 TaxID=3457436 RepID=UPI003FCCBC50
MKVNEAIRFIRKSKGVTQVHVAGKLGISLQTYNGYELGRRQIKVELIKDVAKALDVPVEYFFDHKLYETKNYLGSKEVI